MYNCTIISAIIIEYEIRYHWLLMLCHYVVSRYVNLCMNENHVKKFNCNEV